MNKKLAKLGAASLLAVGAGTMLMKKNNISQKLFDSLFEEGIQLVPPITDQ